MRTLPTTLAMRYLKGQRRFRGAPYYGNSPFANENEAFEILRRCTGQDFETDIAKWAEWLKHNRFKPLK